MDDLLLRIARCPNVEEARCSASHPCHAIVGVQPASAETFHLPEPWNGDIRTASLLFVSSNPAIGPFEKYPTIGWSDAHIEDYFMNRFGGGIEEWTKNANRGLRVDGGRWSPFWSAIRSRAGELFEREVVPGRDFALTEVVHCKSFSEKGVRAAAVECADRYLIQTIEASAASVIIVLGKIAEEHVRALVKFDGVSPVIIGGRERVVVTLPHPNARMKRSLVHCSSVSDLEVLRARLRAVGMGHHEAQQPV